MLLLLRCFEARVNLAIETRVTLLTVHCELNVALSSEGIICDGDFHFVHPFIRQLQVVKQQRAILKHQDAVAILGPQVSNDVRPYGLHDSDRFHFVLL